MSDCDPRVFKHFYRCIYATKYNTENIVVTNITRVQLRFRSCHNKSIKFILIETQKKKPAINKPKRLFPHSRTRPIHSQRPKPAEL